MILDDVALLRSFQAVAAAGGSVVLHSETGPVLDLLREQALAAGHVEPIWHERTRPARLEATAIHRAAELAHLAGCPLYIFHVGCRESLSTRSCVPVAVASRSTPRLAPNTCCSPQTSTWAARTANCSSARRRCDHRTTRRRSGRPWPTATWTWSAPTTVRGRGQKKTSRTLRQIPGGVPSIESRLSLVHHFGVGRGLLSLERWVDVCCTNPARLMGLPRKGLLAPGYDADVVIFDPARTKTDLHGFAARGRRLDALRRDNHHRLAKDCALAWQDHR